MDDARCYVAGIDKVYQEWMSYLGVVASVWFFAGVYLAAKRYPDYSHVNQFCSELGACGSPTQDLSPRVNNYPLALIFCGFGFYVISHPQGNWALDSIGVLIMCHGIATAVAGVFPMDADPYTTTPSQACNIHSWAGVVMLLSLLIAPLLVWFVTPLEKGFAWFSTACVLMCIGFSFKLAKAYKLKRGVGLYQRLSYGAQLVWLSALAVIF